MYIYNSSVASQNAGFMRNLPRARARHIQDRGGPPSVSPGPRLADTSMARMLPLPVPYVSRFTSPFAKGRTARPAPVRLRPCEPGTQVPFADAVRTRLLFGVGVRWLLSQMRYAR